MRRVGHEALASPRRAEVATTVVAALGDDGGARPHRRERRARRDKHIGGAPVGLGGWRLVFIVNIPVGVAVIGGTLAFAGHQRRVCARFWRPAVPRAE